MIDNLFGERVTVTRFLCERPYLGQARTHRKSRINKKWRKRYGIKLGPCPGKEFSVRGMGFFVCPHVMAELEKIEELKKDPMRGVLIPPPAAIMNSVI